MLNLMRKRLNKKGFTLIELVVVIAILGILAMIAIPRFAGIRDSAQDQANQTTATEILNAAEVYYIDQDGDEPTIADLMSNDYLRDGDYSDFTLAGSDGVYTVSWTIDGGGSVGGTTPTTTT